MKLNWFSPLAPAKTDIAHYTKRLLPELARIADVTLWTDQNNWDRELEALAQVKSYRLDRMPWVELNRGELTYYNLGNNPDFHGNIWHASRLLPGVVILHDFRLHHFFDGLYRVQLRDLRSYLSVMTKYYGEKGRADALDCYEREARNIDDMAARYPLTQLAAENALGVVVHTDEAFSELRKDLQSPLAYIPLPFPAHDNGQQREHRFHGKIRLVVFGYIGRSRRLVSILHAIAGMEDRDRLQLDVFGCILKDEKELRSQVKALKLSRQVKFHGFQPEPDLDSQLAEADLAINLRYPTMGEASGSQLRIWAHSLPSMVSKVGWYASLPPDTVAFVRVDENEVFDIQTHLKRLMVEPEHFRRMGARGRRVLEECHSPGAYVTNQMTLAERARRFRSRLAGLELAERAAGCLADLSLHSVAPATLRRVATNIESLGPRN